MEFSKKLKKLRAEKGISQQKLADLLFVSRSAVAKWENGLGLPSEGAYESLAEFFGVPKAFLTTDEPEKIVIEKNKKIKKLSGSMCAVIAAVVFALIVYILFHPVSYYASAGWDRIEVQTTLEDVPAFEITDKNIVNDFVDVLNSVSFRKSLRITGESPDNLQAVFYVRSDDGEGDDIWLCSSGHGRFSVYIWNGTEELVACDAERIGNYLFQLIGNKK